MENLSPIFERAVALVATMLVCGLYGAGVRRPFGSLPRIPDVPIWLWHSKWRVRIADLTFAAFIIAMLIILFVQMDAVTFLVLGYFSFVTAELLSYKIRLAPSFYISVALALLAIALITPLDWILSSTLAAVSLDH